MSSTVPIDIDKVIYWCDMVTSTPNTSQDLHAAKLADDTHVSIVERTPSPPLLVSDSSMAEQEHASGQVCEVKQGSICDSPPCQQKTENDNEEKAKSDRMDVSYTKDVTRICGSEARNTLNDSIGVTSATGSDVSEARTHRLQNKLQATMQILKNKEETIRVQAQSLALAEARIAALSGQQTASPHKRNSASECHVEMTDAVTQLQDSSAGRLSDGLSVLQELYRECFYDSVKQEKMIDLLRQSLRDSRLVERQQTERIGRLSGEMRARQASLDQCQDIALEVESLKVDISNFLNSSTNNDSGVWERDEATAGALAADLQYISGQLRRLQTLLYADCTCGLEEENNKLKRTNESLEIQIGQLRERVSELEAAADDKESAQPQRLADTEQELQRMKHKLKSLEKGAREQSASRDALSQRVSSLEGLLEEKTAELSSARERCEEQEATIRQLQEDLDRANVAARENEMVRNEVSQLSQQVEAWRAQLAAGQLRLRRLRARLQQARDHCAHLATHYREKEKLSMELQSQLDEAQTRGAALCGEARRALCHVRRTLRDMRGRQREQEEKIRQQDMLIHTLQQDPSRSNTERSSASDEPCCSKYLARIEVRRSDHSCTGASEMTSCPQCPERRNRRSSGSEMASSPAPPTPPRRLLRKKPMCGEKNCQCPMKREACISTALSRHTICNVFPRREPSPTDELLERVERAHSALADAHRRWSRHSAPRAPRT